MKDLAKLRRELKAKVDEARALHTSAQNESRSFTKEENDQYNGLMAEIDNRRAEIEREERLQQLEMSSPAPAEAGPNEIREFGDFLQTVRWNPGDSSLQRRNIKGSDERGERRDMSMGVGAAGGILVPDQAQQALRMISPQDAIMRPRAQVIPAGDPPDAAVPIPALDQTGAQGVYSGVAVQWLAEGGAKPQTEPSLTEIRLEPQEVAAHVVVTDKLLRNSAAAGTLVQNLLRKAIIGTEDWAFLRGVGGFQPWGIIGHPATINIARTVANQVAYADVSAMYSRALFGGRMVWIGSQSLLPQLMTMVDAGNNLIWQPNAREGAPGTLLGIPFVLNQRSPVLGQLGDLILVDPDYYLIKDGSGIAIEASQHPLFVSNRTVIKAYWNVDGQPWLSAPMVQEDGVTTVSPFIALQ